jgi:transposase-like protein
MIGNELRSLWEQRLAEQQASGQSIAAWCNHHSIRAHQFYYWRRKMRLGQVDNSQQVKWLSLGLERVSLDPDTIAVHIGQATIEIKKGFDQQLLREIVQVLQTI